jgi:hypothetical protein
MRITPHLRYNTPMVLNINLPQRAINAIYGGIALIIGMTFIGCLAQWRDDWKLTHQPNTSTEQFGNKTMSMIAAIPGDHLFGKSAGGKIPISSLELRVTGIVKVEDEHGNEVSKAYISQAGQAAKIYQIGDNITDNVKIHSISADTIILDNGGELEKLPLPREPLVFKPRDDTERN